MTIAVGEMFAGRRVDAIVYRGAGSVVYRAFDLNVGRPAALKVFDALASNDPGLARFMREWELAASIEHPNLIPIYECGEEGGIPFVAMRYVDGPNLGELIRSKGKLDPASAARIVGQAAAGIEAAHARGLVHRNLRPSKILLTAEGRVIVTGLGEPARKLSAQPPGGLIGSFDFIAPEQIQGNAVSRETDVYLLGCLVFYAVMGYTVEQQVVSSGRAPWTLLDSGPDLEEMAGVLLGLDPAGSRARPAPLLLEAIRRSLATQPEDRPDLNEFGEMLQAPFRDTPSRFWRAAVVPSRAPAKFQVLDTLVVRHAGADRKIDLCSGDLTAIPASEACDLLVVSAIPGSYFPTQGSLIGALARKGVSIEALAQRKQVDLRNTCSCWLSEELGGPADRLGYRRILCFEPAGEGSPAEFVGDIFRALLPFLGESGFRTVAMPVVSSGDAGNPVAEMLRALVEAATNWMSLGVSLERLLIFTPLTPDKQEEARALFAELKRSHAPSATAQDETWDYDIFLSYAHADGEHAAFIAEELEQAEPAVRLFLDRQRLNPGSSWQHEIFDALDSSNRVLALYSPDYVRSKVCKEEFNIAWARGRELERQVLFPVYLFTAPLPTYMKLVQYVDCREGARDLLSSACKRVLTDGTGEQPALN